MNTVPITIPPNLQAADLEQWYRFADRESVLAFLAEYPFLVPLLGDAYLHIQQCFAQADPYLEVWLDQELNELNLLLHIGADGPDKEVWDAFDRFTDEWAGPHFPETLNLLGVMN
jgi:hypothetical protein